MQETKKARQESGPVLIVLYEPSHAGKSTFAYTLADTFTIISSDEIRKQYSVGFKGPGKEKMIWSIFDSMKCKALNGVAMLSSMHAIFPTRQDGIRWKIVIYQEFSNKADRLHNDGFIMRDIKFNWINQSKSVRDVPHDEKHTKPLNRCFPRGPD